MKTRLLLFLLFAFLFGNAQVNVTEGFESGVAPVGWTSGGSITTTPTSGLACNGSYKLMSAIMPFSNPFSVIYTSGYVSNGNSVNVSFNYRANSEATAAAYVARQRAETPSSEAFETEMIDQLKSENKIANPKNYTIELSKETLVIDGQKQPEALRDQLLDAYKKQTGKPMGSQDKFILKNEE